MTENELRNYFVNMARSYIGAVEGSTKHLDIVATYNSIHPLPRSYKLKTTDAWCAATVSAMAAKCGMLDIIPAECSCPAQISLWQHMGRWQEDDAYVPRPGDIIYYDWQDSGSGDNRGVADHVGIVAKVSGGTITVVEGNKNDAVSYRDIAINGRFIRGYGLPNFAQKAQNDEEEDNMVRYHKLNEIPEGVYRDTIKGLIDDGVVKGKAGGDLDLSEDMVRCIVFLLRIIDRMLKSGK